MRGWMEKPSCSLREAKTDFQALQNAFDSSFTRRMVSCLFDLLYLGGYDLRSTPLVKRKRLLFSLVGEHVANGEGLIRYSDHIHGQGVEVFAEALPWKSSGY